MEVNGTGFRKILKKWDKHAKSSTKEIYLSRQIEIQPCFNKEILTEMTDIASTQLSDLEKLIEESTSLNPSDELMDSSASRRVVAFTSDLDDAEVEAFKYLAENKQSQLQEFIASKQSLIQSEDGTRFCSNLFLCFCGIASIECLSILLATGRVNINAVDDVNDRNCLHEAAMSGRLDVIQIALNQGADLNASDIYGRRPLHYAAMQGHHACASFLIDVGTNVNLLDHDENSPLVLAVIGGHTKCVEIFLSKKAVFEQQSPTAPIPLFLACKHGFTTISLLLLQQGAKMIQNADGAEPLHVACREGHAEMTKLLIDHKANIESKDPFNGWSPVFFAASEGHCECIKILLGAGCKIDIKDDIGWLPWTYALYRGHIKAASLLSVKDAEMIMKLSVPVEALPAVGTQIKPMAPSSLFHEATPPHDSGDIIMDDIPSLSLPPPIIPFRIYGHNYLENMVHLEISFGMMYGSSASKQSHSPIRLFSSRQLSSMKLIVSSTPDDGVPHSLILPLKDDIEVLTFMVDDTRDYSIQFDIYPTFGSKVIARAVVLRSQLHQILSRRIDGDGEAELAFCPLFDHRLHAVGEISFGVSIVKPFVHAGLGIGGKIETYWKSTKVVQNPKPATAAGDSVQSFITASSLVEEYIQLTVQLTKDHIPVIYDKLFLPIDHVNIRLCQVTYEQARNIFLESKGPNESHMKAETGLSKGQKQLSVNELSVLIYESFMTLEEILLKLPLSIGVQVHLEYPTSFQRLKHGLLELTDINSFVDTVLRKVYDTPNQRSIIFSSFNPCVCTAINWKQPNYGVFFATRCGFGTDLEEQVDKRCTSIKEAIKFAKSSNFLGMICEATPLIQMPVLVNTIKESGLILATFGSMNDSLTNLKAQQGYDIDALISGKVFRYTT